MIANIIVIIDVTVTFKRTEGEREVGGLEGGTEGGKE